jgi:hypothetical protein
MLPDWDSGVRQESSFQMTERSRQGITGFDWGSSIRVLPPFAEVDGVSAKHIVRGREKTRDNTLNPRGSWTCGRKSSGGRVITTGMDGNTASPASHYQGELMLRCELGLYLLMILAEDMKGAGIKPSNTYQSRLFATCHFLNNPLCHQPLLWIKGVLYSV